MNTNTIADWRETIRKERRYVGRKPYSHNIISIALGAIAKIAGDEEANKAITDFNLDSLGWNIIATGKEPDPVGRQG